MQQTKRGHGNDIEGSVCRGRKESRESVDDRKGGGTEDAEGEDRKCGEGKGQIGGEVETQREIASESKGVEKRR